MQEILNLILVIEEYQDKEYLTYHVGDFDDLILKSIYILENYPINKSAIIKPINVMGDISGSVIVLNDNITDVEKSLAEFGGMFMGRYLEG